MDPFSVLNELVLCLFASAEGRNMLFILVTLLVFPTTNFSSNYQSKDVIFFLRLKFKNVSFCFVLFCFIFCVLLSFCFFTIYNIHNEVTV